MHFLTELNRIVQVSRLTVFKSLLVTESKTVGISLAYSLERREIVELRAAAREPAETGDVYDTQTWKWTLSSNQFAFILGVKYVIHCIYEVSAGHGLVYSFGN